MVENDKNIISSNIKLLSILRSAGLKNTVFFSLCSKICCDSVKEIGISESVFVAILAVIGLLLPIFK